MFMTFVCFSLKNPVHFYTISIYKYNYMNCQTFSYNLTANNNVSGLPKGHYSLLFIYDVLNK